jgi:hypothetical protein
MPDHVIIDIFGEYDYNRLFGMYPDDIKKMTPIPSSYKGLVSLLNSLIKTKRIFMMDKESGVAWEASGIIGYEGDKLLLFHER